MGFGLRSAVVAFAMTSASLVGLAGLGWRRRLRRLSGKELVRFSVRLLDLGFGGDKPPPIDYREHGKIVVPPKMELPPPGSTASVDPAWPVNQEILRRKAQKEEGKKTIAGVGDARLRYTHPFPANDARDGSRRRSGGKRGEVHRLLRIDVEHA